MVRGFSFEISGSEFRGSVCRVRGSMFSGSRVGGSGFRGVWGLWFRVWGSGLSWFGVFIVRGFQVRGFGFVVRGWGFAVF